MFGRLPLGTAQTRRDGERRCSGVGQAFPRTHGTWRGHRHVPYTRRPASLHARPRRRTGSIRVATGQCRKWEHRDARPLRRRIGPPGGTVKTSSNRGWDSVGQEEEQGRRRAPRRPQSTVMAYRPSMPFAHRTSCASSSSIDRGSRALPAALRRGPARRPA